MNRKVSGVALDTKIRPRKEEKVTENMSELSLNPQDPIREDPFVIFIFGSDHHGVSDAGFAVCDLRDVLNGESRFRKSV